MAAPERRAEASGEDIAGHGRVQHGQRPVLELRRSVEDTSKQLHGYEFHPLWSFIPDRVWTGDD
jgi:hypothetical protein